MPGRSGPGFGVLEVDLGPGVRAGFTTRSPADDGADANLGLGVADDPAAVLDRRRRLARWAGGPVAWSTQVHGTAVLDLPGVRGADRTAAAVPVDLPARGAGSREGPVGSDGPAGEPCGEADALVAGPGAGVAVVVADCVPVLLVDPATGVVAAVHAGRRGLVDGVVQAAVARMVARGARPADLRAAVGPAICGRCYEVPADLRDTVAAVVPDVAARTSWGTPALDLPAGVAAVLRTAGVGHVHPTGLCTRTDERFFSHRRSMATGAAEGRCAGVVRSAAPGPGVSDDGGAVGAC